MYWSNADLAPILSILTQSYFLLHSDSWPVWCIRSNGLRVWGCRQCRGAHPKAPSDAIMQRLSKFRICTYYGATHSMVRAMHIDALCIFSVERGFYLILLTENQVLVLILVSSVLVSIFGELERQKQNINGWDCVGCQFRNCNHQHRRLIVINNAWKPQSASWTARFKNSIYAQTAEGQ